MRKPNLIGWRSRCLFLLLALIGAAGGGSASSLPPGFTELSIARPDGKPWRDAAGIEFARDGRMFVWERAGRVWIVGASPKSDQPFIDLSNEIDTSGTLGLSGFTMDSHFEKNGYIYLFYAVAAQRAKNGPAIGRLVRYRLNEKGLDPASRRVLLGETLVDGSVSSSCVVTDAGQGPGGLAFGNDGTLLAACGDGASSRSQDGGSDPTTQYQEALAAGLMRPSENVGAFRAQMVDSLSGKILRLDAATGDGVPSNPFYDATAPRSARSRVWLLGLHDPQHFAVRPGSGSPQAEEGRPGTLYIGDRGRASWESLAIARVGRINFGWPLYEGVGNEVTDYARLGVFNLEAPNPLAPTACAQPYFHFEDLIRAEPLGAIAWPNPCRANIEVPATDDVFVRERPAIDWLHGGRDARWAAVNASGEPVALTLGTPESNGTVVSGSLFGGTLSVGGTWMVSPNAPPLLRDRYVHADSGGQWIKAFTFDEEDNALAVQDLIEQGGAIRALAMDPQTGRLCYVTDVSGSQVRCLTYPSQKAAAATQASPTAISSAASIGRSAATGAAVRASTGLSRSPGASRTVGSAAASRSAASPVPANSSTWSQADIGAVKPAGSFSLNGSTFTVNGSGVDIWGTSDEFHFVYQTLSGDGSITARVVSETNTSPWAKSGVMIRQSLATGSKYAAVELTPGNGAVLQDRQATGGEAGSTVGPAKISAPYWVRLVRAGTTVTGYVSPDGAAWTLIGHYTITMTNPVDIGLEVTSHANGSLCTVVFDNVTISSAAPPDTQPPTVPTGLAVTTVTASSVALSWSASTDLPNPGGSGVGGYYIYRNGNTTTPIATVTSGTTFTDTGLASGTTYTYQVAAFDNASPANVSSASGSVNATTQVGVTSSWSHADIGAVKPAGSYSLNGSTFTVNGSGVDIWGTSDEFQFVYQSLSGDGSITARVVSETNTSPWAKSGVMIRQSLATGSRYAAVELTPGNGAVLQYRANTGGEAGSIVGPTKVKAPYWARLVRAGTTLTGYVSPDGATWTLIGHYTVTMTDPVDIGLEVTSHANGSLCTVVFDNVTVSSAAAADTQAPTVPTGLAVTTVTTSSIALSWTASTDLPNPGGTGVGGYFIYRNGNTATPFATVTSGTTFTDSGLASGTTYTYQVAAFDKATPPNVSSASSAVPGTTASPDTQAPTVPTGLTETTVTASGVTFSWNASTDLPNPGGTGVGGYFIYRNGNIATPIATVTSGTTFTDTGLASGTTYTYQVAAFDNATPPNVSVPSSALTATTSAPDTQAPTVPTGLNVANVTAASITFTWSPSTDLPNPGGSGVGGYFVYRNGNTTTPIATVTSGTTFTDSGLVANSSYNYQVAAFDSATPPNVSAPSDVIGATTAGVVGASQISALSVSNAGTAYVVCGGGSTCSQGFLAGAAPYVDNAAININAPIPGALLGQTFIQTAQSDAATAPGSANFLSFTLGTSAIVYVAHDVQSTPPPAWLTSAFLDTGLSVTNNHGSPGSTLEIYSNIYPSGAQVELGSNLASGAASGDMYSVIVAPTAGNTIAPNAPANLSPIPNCQTAAVVGFSWDAATVNLGGAALAGYRIVRDGTLIATVSYAQTSFQDTSVLQSSTYGYSVTAFDQAGNASPAASLSVTTNATSATGDAPYCPSTLITAMSFDFANGYSETNGNGNTGPTNLNDRPPYTDGSDLWSVTQAADGNIYAVFGDGWGLCGMADTGSTQNQDYTSFGVAKMTAAPSGSGCPAGLSNLYGGYNSGRPYGGYSTCCTSTNGLILGKASSVVAIGNDFYGLASAWRSGDASNWINIQQNNVPPLGTPQNHQEIISSTGAGNGAQQWVDSGIDLCNGTGTAAKPIWGGALGACPGGFIQFGAGYTGVPASLAGYVYLYAIPTPAFLNGTGPTATYLVRVPITPSVQLLNPNAYQFFAGLDANGNPIWSNNSAQKKSVFTDLIDQKYQYVSADGTACAGQTIQMAMGVGEAVYDQQLGRFIASAQGGHVGQVAFYESPNPWGPWSLISYNNLDMGNIFASGWGAAGGGLGGGYCSNGSYIKAESLGVHIANGLTDSTGTVLKVIFSSSGEAPASAGPLGGGNNNSNGFGNSMDSFNMVQATLTVSQP